MVNTLMIQGQTISIIPDLFHLTYVLNPGAAFGIFAGKTTFFIMVTLVVVGLVLYFYKQIPKEKWLLKLGLALQVGGALGNLIDRVRTGMVIDFFDFRVWPVFNMADIAIVLGVGILIIEILRYDEKKEVY